MMAVVKKSHGAHSIELKSGRMQQVCWIPRLWDGPSLAQKKKATQTSPLQGAPCITGLLRRVLHELFVKMSVFSAHREQFAVRAALDDLAFINDQNAVSL